MMDGAAPATASGDSINRDFIPVYDGTPAMSRERKHRVTAWAASTASAQDKRALRVIQSLRSEGRKVTEHLGPEQSTWAPN